MEKRTKCLVFSFCGVKIGDGWICEAAEIFSADIETTKKKIGPPDSQQEFRILPRVFFFFLPFFNIFFLELMVDEPG